MDRLFKYLVVGLLFPAFLGVTPAVFLISRAGAQAAPTATMPAPLQKDFAAEIRPEDFTGALDIRIHPDQGKLQPPAELLVKDPRGRKIGFDPRTSRMYREIPNAHYEFEGIDDAVSGAPGPQSGIIELRNPLPGIYVLEIIGKEPGDYTVEITGFDKSLNTSKIFLKKAHTKPMSARTFTFRYDSRHGVKSGTSGKPANSPEKH